MSKAPLVVHVLYRLTVGGLETLVVECINRMPADKFRHAIVCITDYTDFAEKITQPGVEIIALDKPPGPGLGTHLAFWKLMRRLKPAVLHTYNLAALEYCFTAALAGVPVRLHAVHGRDMSDPDGTNRKHNLLRRMLIPFIDRYIAVSGDLQRWLKNVVRVPDAKNLLIKNGVDTERFSPGENASVLAESGCLRPDCFVIGTVGRIQDVKNHDGLVDAFILLREMFPSNRDQLRLAIIGDGPLMPAIKEKIARAGIVDAVWLPGSRADIAEILRTFSVFALSSHAEGTPVAVLEAMATGIPVVATRVGGVPEVVIDNVTGTLVPPADPTALATALATYFLQPELKVRHGAAGRDNVERLNSLKAMLASYAELYTGLCTSKSKFKETIKSCAE
jgi:sugar transferase (PEP-CTERM/EpsH1 system associated)